MKKSIQHRFFYAQPPETVWEYLTKPELIELWLMKNTFQPIIGAEFQFRTGPIASLDFDGIVYCKVLEIVPFETLSYSWQSGPGDGKITLDSTVIWTLKRTDKGTELFLEHSGFAKDENSPLFNGLNHGWVEKLQNIDKLLNEKSHGNTNA